MCIRDRLYALLYIGVNLSTTMLVYDYVFNASQGLTTLTLSLIHI